MMDFTRNGYQWFQVAEAGYDNMVRLARLVIAPKQ